MSVVFFKLTGSGNDFVMVDGRSTTPADWPVERIRAICEPLGHKVYAIVNYDGFEINRELEDTYLQTIQELSERYYLGVTRFTSNAFARAKLGETLEKRGLAAHMYGTEEEAKAAVRDTLPRER